MANLLDELMQEYEDHRYEKAVVGVIEEESEYDERYPYVFIETPILLYWSYQNKFLTEQINTLVSLYETTLIPLTHQKLMDMMRGTIGNVFFSEHVKKEYRDFLVDYTDIVSGYTVQYQNDLKNLYPKMRTYSEIPQTDEEYNKILSMLDMRYQEYSNGQLHRQKTIM